MSIPPKPKDRSIASRLRSFAFAARGILLLLKQEPNARLHLLATLLVTALGLWLDLSAYDWALLSLCIAAVWAAEGFNSAIEALCDHLHPDQHKKIGQVKDLAASAVLLASVGALAVGLFILGPPLLKQLF